MNKIGYIFRIIEVSSLILILNTLINIKYERNANL